MNPRMRDYMMNRDRRMQNDDRRMMRDERNPYGSRGGYISSRRPSSRDRGYYDERDGRSGYYEGEFRGSMNDNDYRDYDDMRDRRGRDYDYDYRYSDYDDSDYADDNILSQKELMKWKKKLCANMEKSECDMFSEEKILKRAKDMGIKFEKYSEDEFYITVLMMFSDYCSTLGKASIDMYIKLAKDFLEDKDAGVRFSEKLTAYHDYIVNA